MIFLILIAGEIVNGKFIFLSDGKFQNLFPKNGNFCQFLVINFTFFGNQDLNEQNRGVRDFHRNSNHREAWTRIRLVKR